MPAQAPLQHHSYKHQLLVPCYPFKPLDTDSCLPLLDPAGSNPTWHSVATSRLQRLLPCWCWLRASRVSVESSGHSAGGHPSLRRSRSTHLAGLASPSCQAPTAPARPHARSEWKMLHAATPASLSAEVWLHTSVRSLACVCSLACRPGYTPR
jgi:hypothetical protein